MPPQFDIHHPPAVNREQCVSAPFNAQLETDSALLNTTEPRAFSQL
jgi:hypothetical protein